LIFWVLGLFASAVDFAPAASVMIGSGRERKRRTLDGRFFSAKQFLLLFSNRLTALRGIGRNAISPQLLHGAGDEV
jgi:hypothetical protein